MKVSQAISTRSSIRAFTDKAVKIETVTRVFEAAARAPSGGNVQPWKIVILSEQKLANFKALMKLKMADPDDQEQPEYQVYPPKLQEPYRTARYEVGEDMYALLNIPREDKQARREWFANNFQFFGAPAAAFCFVDKCMGAPQWSDLGMYLQSAMLLFREEDIDTCTQECWSFYPKTVHEFCEVSDDWMVFCGMAIGFADHEHPVNQLRTKRLPTSDWLKVL